MKYAYLENGIVIDRVGNEPFALFQHAYAEKFIECPDHVDHFWRFDGTNWLEPLPHIKTQEELSAEVTATLIAFMAEKNIESIGEANALLSSTNPAWVIEAQTVVRLWDETWQAFDANQTLPVLMW